MYKKVIILSASPRKNGNSDTLCNQFMQGAIDAGHQAEKIFLRNKKINYCIGCGVCNTTHKCVQTDDMEDILNKMLAADVLVLATPVYFYTMDAQMKTLIDRTVPRYTEMTNKEVYFIVTAADTEQANLERTVDGLRGFTADCLEGTTEKGILYATDVWQVGEINGTPAMQQAYEMGKSV